MAIEYRRDEHRVHLIVYHLIWCPKRRKPVLVGDVARAFPTTPAYQIIKECKGITSRELRLKYQDLHKIPSLWTRSYFASTAGNVSQTVIQHYIEAQKGL